MAVGVHVVLPGASKEQYDGVRKAVGWLDSPPVGGISHVTWWEGGDCHNVGAWDSEEAFNAFGEQRLSPGMAKAGVAVEPQATFHAAHDVFTPPAAKLTS